MKKISLLGCLLLLLASCGPEKDKVRIKGEFKNLENAEFYVYDAGEGFAGFDTIRIEGGKFSKDILLHDEKVLTLLYPNFSRTFIVAEPGKTIEIKSNAEHLDDTDVQGTEANKRLSDFHRKNLNKPAGDLHLAAAQYIRDNSKTLDALAVYLQYFAEQKNPHPVEVLPLLDLLCKGMPKNPDVVNLNRQQRPLLENGKGRKLGDFSAQTLENTTVSLNTYAGQPLLIVFFASWHPDSHAILAEMNRMRRASGGRLRTLAVSLDVDRRRCLDYIKNDTVSAAQTICDELSFDSPLATAIGLRYVPGNILLDSEGKVVGRDLRREDLQREVTKLCR